MEAVRLVAAGRIELVDVPDPHPANGEVVVRVAACGVCGSDLSCYKTGVFAPIVLGHEFSGVVEALGGGVDPSLAGARVVADPKIACGKCEDCTAGAPNRCVEALTHGIGSGRAGALAKRVSVPAACLHAVPDDVPLDRAALAEPLSVALHGLSRAGVQAGESAIVIGLGSIGLLTVAALRAAGAHPVTGIDPVQARRRVAIELGADRAAAPEQMFDVGPASLVVECSGRPENVQQAANHTRAGGRVLLLGVPMSEAAVMPMVWVAREMTIIGSISQTSKDLDDALGLLAREPALSKIVSRTVPLSGAPGLFDELLKPDADAKVLVTP
jgi:threonine dehydrogenase-like Zn-dependent dehydrogenase